MKSFFLCIGLLIAVEAVQAQVINTNSTSGTIHAKLTAEQNSQIADLNSKYLNQTRAIIADQTLPRDARMAKLKLVVEERDSKLAKVLATPSPTTLTHTNAVVTILTGKNAKLLAGLDLSEEQAVQIEDLLKTSFAKMQATIANTTLGQNAQMAQMQKDKAEYDTTLAKILTTTQLAKLRSNQLAMQTKPQSRLVPQHTN